jgi:hypothetical protein
MAGELRIEDHPLLGPAPDAGRVAISFDGRKLEARAGEPVAAALLAHGIRAFRTMPGTDEPRGIFTGVGRSLEELGTVNGEASVPLMSTPVEDGMAVTTQRGLGEWGDGA